MAQPPGYTSDWAVPPELFTNGSKLVRVRMGEKKIPVMSRIDAAGI